MQRLIAVGTAALVLANGSWNRSSAHDDSPAQDAKPAVAVITVTNLMKGQILTPAVFVTHNAEMPPLFVAGEASSPELSALAEQGSTLGLVNKYNAEEGALSVTRLADFIRPGNSGTVTVTFDAEHRLVSSASMIEMTNDGFVSLQGVEVPCEGTSTFLLTGWDAGSEANTELCSQIPAPCPQPPRPGSCGAAAVEGFVHVHSGIHGCGGFPPETFDWTYPVARVTIQASAEQSPDGALEAACSDHHASEESDADGSGDESNGNGGAIPVGPG